MQTSKAALKASSRASSLQRPPVEYDHRVALRESSRSLVLQRFPDLADLVEAGTLVCVERSALYVERRTDGYVEPELVLLIGTSHASSSSAEEVRRTIEVARPDNVVVELCRSRSSVMYRADDGGTASTSPSRAMSSSRASNPLSLSGAGGEDFFATFKRTLELGGQSAFLLRLLLGKVSSRLASDMDVETAGEFIAARVAAEATGAQLVLGDRPIEVTLRRAWERLSFQKKIEFANMMWVAYTSQQSDQSRDLLEALRKDDDAVNSMLVALSERFPELADAFIHERTFLIETLIHSHPPSPALTHSH
jgi:pheromone shutdown protein TraB